MDASSIIKPVINGQAASTQNSESAEKGQAQKNKDMFLQLLVAEMQYQDPLEPTDNSQYIQQLYSMSQTESILSVQEEMEDLSARNLVGKYVTVQDPTTGDVTEGKVDSVAEVGGVTKVSINGELFEIGQVKQIHDEKYFLAVSASDALTSLLAALPEKEYLNRGHQKDLESAVDLYNSMDEYTKGFLKQENVDKLTSLVARMNELLKTQKPEETAPEGETTEGSDKVEESTEAEKTE